MPTDGRAGAGARGVGGSIVTLSVVLTCVLVQLAAGVSQTLPGFHFRPDRYWINDPNGPMYYKGLYHFFYQYNPKGVNWGTPVWGHAVSKNLIDWTLLEPALVPSEKFDINGCWSGSATILPNGVPAIMYTGVDVYGQQVQNVAYPYNMSDPLLRHWWKPKYNPVITADHGVNGSAFRDPTTAWYGRDRSWRVVVGSKDGPRGLAVLYLSVDFKNWVKARHLLHSGMTGMWECPDIYPVGGSGGKVKFVLNLSLELKRHEYYTIGSYDHATDRYTPDPHFQDNESGLRYDYGNFYASKSFFDPAKGRRVVWAWANESDTSSDDRLKGWAGIQAVPRQIRLSRSGKQLLLWPVKEVDSLRQKQVKISNEVVKRGGFFEVTGIKSVQSDVEVVFTIKDLGKAEQIDAGWQTDPQALCAKRGADVKSGVGPFGLWTLASGDLRERTAVFFAVFKAHNASNHVVLMCVDPTRSTYKQDVHRPTFAAFMDIDIAKTQKIALRTLIDHSVVESFGANGRTCILSRVYPTQADGHKAHLFVFNNGESDIQITSLRAWEMRSANISAL